MQSSQTTDKDIELTAKLETVISLDAQIAALARLREESVRMSLSLDSQIALLAARREDAVKRAIPEVESLAESRLPPRPKVQRRDLWD